MDDCLDRMAQFPDKCFRAVICDPPYGKTSKQWDKLIDFSKVWSQLSRLLQDRGAVLIFGQEPFSSLVRVSNLDWFKYDWVWEKTPNGYLNANVRPLVCTEDIMVFSPSSASPSKRILSVMGYNPQGLVEVNIKKTNGSQDRGKALHKMGSSNQLISGTEYTQKFTNYPKQIIKFNGDGEGLHPAQKPILLMEYLVKTYTNQGDRVLDFTMGSGSTGVACINTGRRFVGIENNTEHFEVARKRLCDALNNLSKEA